MVNPYAFGDVVKGKSVAVIGGGWAGLSAVTRLQESGIKVTLMERSRILGGRSASFWDKEFGEWLDHGNHLFAGAYHESLRLLNLWGTSSLIDFTIGSEIPWLMSDGTRHVFRTSNSSIGSLSSLLKFNFLTMREKFQFIKTLRRIQRYCRSPNNLDITLDRLINAPKDGAVAGFFEALSLAVMNAPSHLVAAQPFANAICEGLLNPGSIGKIGLPLSPLKEIIADGAERYFKTGDVTLLKGCDVRELERRDDIWVIKTNVGEYNFSAIILSVPPIEALRLLPIAKFGNIFSFDINDVTFSPIMGIHCTFDAPVLKFPFAHLYNGEAHWVFGRGAPEAEGWRHVSFIISHAVRSDNDKDTELIPRIVEDFRKRIPAAHAARLLRQRSVRTVRATPLLTPEFEAVRSESDIGLPGLFIAGDWCKTGLPATIESAARSGRNAADLMIKYCGIS